MRKLLTQAGHDIEHKTIEMINKFCHYCQIKGEAPQQFKFTLKKDVDFNYKIIMDVMYLDRKPVLYMVDVATAFQAGRFLNNMSAKDIWKTLRQCWIDTYLGPPEIVTYDASINFDFMEFCAKTKMLGITYHQIPVEAHWSIEKVEKYHAPMYRTYNIIQAEIQGIISKNIMLQIAFKAVNDTAGPNGLVLTLFIFGAYPCIIMDSLPLSSQQQQANVMAKAMSKLCKLKVRRGVQNVLNICYGLNTIQTLPLALNLGSEVRIF